MKKSVSPAGPLTLWTALFALILLALVEVMCYFLLPDQPPAWLALNVPNIPSDLYKEIVMIVVVGVMVLWTLLQWLVVRRIGRKALVDKEAIDKPAGGETKQDAIREREKRLHQDKKMFLHLISVLQTEGRLLDFLNEDLDQYEDNQVGAAVRGVHERCKLALSKYVSLQPLANQAEGETVTVSPGFDPGSYRLSGNVTGDPPFEGSLVHKGWRAEGLNMPSFSFSGDPEIIAPMEVNVE